MVSRGRGTHVWGRYPSPNASWVMVTWGTPPPSLPNRMADTCENIIFKKHRLRAVISVTLSIIAFVSHIAAFSTTTNSVSVTFNFSSNGVSTYTNYQNTNYLLNREIRLDGPHAEKLTMAFLITHTSSKLKVTNVTIRGHLIRDIGNCCGVTCFTLLKMVLNGSKDKNSLNIPSLLLGLFL